jgi:hypothetical protein
VSFLFDGVNDSLAGTFSSTYGDPITIALFVKVTVHPAAVTWLFATGNSSSSNDNSYANRLTSTDDAWSAIARTTTNGSATKTAVNIDGVWAGYVGKYTSNTSRTVYIQSLANTATDTTSIVVPDVIQFLRAGTDFANGSDFSGRLAELAIWKIALSDAEITSYLAGTVASSIAASDLIGYWPLSSADLTNLGVDTGGDLTASGNAAFDADHPTISSSGTTISPNTAGLSV